MSVATSAPTVSLFRIIVVIIILLQFNSILVKSECPYLLKGSKLSNSGVVPPNGNSHPLFWNEDIGSASSSSSSSTFPSPTSTTSTFAAANGFPSDEILKSYGELVEKLDWEQVRSDLRQLYRSSNSNWPADYGHYGGLFVRLAWHCSGSYRQSDGRGGCEGGNQRFEPERSWADNTNLDKARSLLTPIKLKYGQGLSWGDLFILAGTEAIKDMGGPVLGFCAGRIDNVDNSQTRLLGPTMEQKELYECEVDGDCKEPLGQNTMGLIYVNPEGPFGVPDAQGAADTIRDVFGRMTMDDRENVALIGGGHTFGKAHGACPDGAGPSPAEDENDPYPGNCGTGRGNDAFTSGFEGPWTANPVQWDNTYMKNLVDYEWEAWMGPGGRWQWRPKIDRNDKRQKWDESFAIPRAPPPYPAGNNETQEIMMMTTDVGLIVDPEYRKYVHEFAEDEDAFANAFQDVWYKLTSRDMGPATRCTGPYVPPPQNFQHPLPDPPTELADMTKVEAALERILSTSSSVNDIHQQQKQHASEFIRLAWQCANTFRITDYLGGCNGARIRYSPGKDWESNIGLNKTLELINPVKTQFGEGLSWADLIVMAGNVGLKSIINASANKRVNDNNYNNVVVPFCPGRTDAEDGSGWDALAFGNDQVLPDSVGALLEINQRRGLIPKEFVVLSWTFYYPSYEVSTKYLRDILISSEPCEDVVTCGLLNHPELRVWTDYYVEVGDAIFIEDLIKVWTKLMTADCFDGPTGNLCLNMNDDGNALFEQQKSKSNLDKQESKLTNVGVMTDIQIYTVGVWTANYNIVAFSLLVVFFVIITARAKKKFSP